MRFSLECQVHECSLKPRFTFKTTLPMAFEHSGALFPFSTFRWQVTITWEHLHHWCFPGWPCSTTMALCSCDDSKDTVDIPTCRSAGVTSRWCSSWMWKKTDESDIKNLCHHQGHCALNTRHCISNMHLLLPYLPLHFSLFVYTCEMECVCVCVCECVSVALQVQRSISSAGGR